jgi:NADH:ubiquinone oxidoreductase subunit K
MNIKIIALIGIIISLISIIKERKNYIILLLTFEFFFINLTLLFLYSSLINDDFIGFLFALYILFIAAIESALGLTLLIVYFKFNF